MEFGETAVERIKQLLGKLNAIDNSERRGFEVREMGEKLTVNLENIFSSLPRPKELRSFYSDDRAVVIRCATRRARPPSNIGSVAGAGTTAGAP